MEPRDSDRDPVGEFHRGDGRVPMYVSRQDGFVGVGSRLGHETHGSLKDRLGGLWGALSTGEGVVGPRWVRLSTLVSPVVGAIVEVGVHEPRGSLSRF